MSIAQVKDNFDNDPDSVSEYDRTKKDLQDFATEQKAAEDKAKAQASARAEWATQHPDEAKS